MHYLGQKVNHPEVCKFPQIPLQELEELHTNIKSLSGFFFSPRELIFANNSQWRPVFQPHASGCFLKSFCLAIDWISTRWCCCDLSPRPFSHLFNDMCLGYSCFSIILSCLDGWRNESTTSFFTVFLLIWAKVHHQNIREGWPLSIKSWLGWPYGNCGVENAEYKTAAVSASVHLWVRRLLCLPPAWLSSVPHAQLCRSDQAFVSRTSCALSDCRWPCLHFWYRRELLL